jgi:hypothetical protein
VNSQSLLIAVKTLVKTEQQFISGGPSASITMETSTATLNPVNLLGTPFLITPGEAEQVRREIEKSTDRVVVDFDGYQFLSSTFLNHAFGQLCINNGWSAETFYDAVKVEDLQEDDIDKFQLTIENAEMRLGMIRKGIDLVEFFATHLPA